MNDVEVAMRVELAAASAAADAVGAIATGAELAAHIAEGGDPFSVVPPPDWFSYSTFDTFDRCPRQYAFRYVCKLPVEQTRPAATFGSAAHAAFEAFTRQRRERADMGETSPTRADLEKCFGAAWAKSGLADEPDAGAWLARAQPMLDQFYAAETATQADGGVTPGSDGPDTVGEELRFRVKLPVDADTLVTVSGFIDRVDRDPSGSLEVIDYKTGIAGDLDQAAQSLQLSIYALGCRDGLRLGRPDKVTLYFVEHGVRATAARTDAELDAIRRDLGDRARVIRRGDFSPTPSNRACGWCDFTAMCDKAVPAGKES